MNSLEGDLWLARKFINFLDDDDDANVNMPSKGTKKFEIYELELDLQRGKIRQ